MKKKYIYINLMAYNAVKYNLTSVYVGKIILYPQWFGGKKIVTQTKSPMTPSNVKWSTSNFLE